MSEPIKVGDLVYVAFPAPCGCSNKVGTHFTVTRVAPLEDGEAFRCKACFAVWSIGDGIYAEGHPGYSFDINRLKRIPPLSELEGTETKQEIPA